jgi:hypothetical protein
MASQRAHLTALKESAAKQNIQESNITNRIDAFLASAMTKNGENSGLTSGSSKKTLLPEMDSSLNKTASVCNKLKANRCPYPSAAEERQRLQSHKKLVLDEYTLSHEDLSDFVSAWRGICQKSSMLEVLPQ